MTVIRLIIRLRVYGRLKPDDGLVILALLCVLVSGMVNTAMIHKTYVFQNVQAHKTPRPPHFDDLATSFSRYQWADAYLFFTAVWAIKGSFLAYYDGLTQRLTYYRRAWWAVIALTVLTYIGTLFAYAFLNGIHIKTARRNESIKYQFSVDVTTDILSESNAPVVKLHQIADLVMQSQRYL